MHNLPASESEDHGITALVDSDLMVYSVGISTGGLAEMRMAQLNPKRHIVATTIDDAGIAFAKKHIAAEGLSERIEIKNEDISQPLPYAASTFDYVYARLVLHYLTKQDLEKALQELHRILKSGGKLFVVVRSTDCPDAKRPDAQTDPVTHITSFTVKELNGRGSHSASRYFHTKESISTYVTDAGFQVEYAKAYDEHLYVDFMRSVRSPESDNVIELLATK